MGGDWTLVPPMPKSVWNALDSIVLTSDSMVPTSDFIVPTSLPSYCVITDVVLGLTIVTGMTFNYLARRTQSQGDNNHTSLGGLSCLGPLHLGTWGLGVGVLACHSDHHNIMMMVEG